MYFPWVGLFEQIALANTFVFYDDVQFQRRGFNNRVQIRHDSGIKWLTVSTVHNDRATPINQIKIDNDFDFRSNHLNILANTYKNTPFCHEMLNLVLDVFSKNFDTISELSEQSILAVCKYFNLDNDINIIKSSQLGTAGKGTQRILDICIKLNASTYITGHGAKNYLDHLEFEKIQVGVEYMNYQLKRYPQIHGGFTPYVSVLDLIANCGKSGIEYICSSTQNWKGFLNGSG